MYWLNGRECRHYMHALKHLRMADDCVAGWPEEGQSAESAVDTISYDLSYLEDAPEEELKRQSDQIGRIAQRLKELNDQLHQE